MNLKEKKINSKLIYQGRVVTLYQDEISLPNGKVGTREVVRHCEASCIIAIKDNQIIMEKQYRYPYDQEILELPAGKVDQGEDPDKCAQRELEEETGYYCENLIKLGKIYPSVGYCDEVIHIYLAENLVQTHNHFDEDEFLEIYFDSLEHILEQIKNGEINDSKTICAINYYLIYRGLISIK